ncbi:MAG TPA: hypothetical protein VLA98_14005 [Solirubrobacteraceae bacterium]|nr:hypothetical protein [Solirubrobacteraceae bacterium]
MKQPRYTIQDLPGGDVSPPMTEHEMVACIVARTGQSIRTAEHAINGLSALVPRVTVPAVTPDRPGVRVTLAR